jgi:hypothetical protein
VGIRSRIFSVPIAVRDFDHSRKTGTDDSLVSGTPLYGFRIEPSGAADDIVIVRAGIFDELEVLNARRPVAELYINGRVSWMCPLEGTAQFEGMLPLPL